GILQRRSLARAGLDDDLEPLSGELRDRLRDERDAPLAGHGLLGDPDLHPAATLCNRRLASRVELVGVFGISLEHLVETAGLPLPGETALITAAFLASKGKLNIVEVIVVAAAAAIIGDNGGYWVGRHWGRRILTRSRRLKRFSERVLPPSERFFAKHGD